MVTFKEIQFLHQKFGSLKFHGHLGSTEMLKIFGSFQKKNGNVKENKASHCKNENV